MRRRTGSRVLLTLLTLVLGIVLVAQFRARGRDRAVVPGGDEQAILLSELVNANQTLRAEIKSLEAQWEVYEGESRSSVLEELVAELNRVRMLNGLVEASGPGVECLIDGPLNALDLQDLTNELRNVGAEAISLNGYRVAISSTYTVQPKGQPALDGQRVGRPYRLQAIGDPATMETALLRPGGLLAILRETYPNAIVECTRRSRMTQGIRRTQVALQYAQPAE